MRCSGKIRCAWTREVALHLLFVCTGNICRSPIAERLAVAYGRRHGILDLEASSAGTGAVVGHPIHHHAVSVIEELGGDASDFAARQLTARIATDADLVLAMTKAHRDAVLTLAPRLLHRTFTLAECARLAADHRPTDIAELAALRSRAAALGVADVADPIGRSADFFSQVGRQIADYLPPIIDLCRRSG